MPPQNDFEYNKSYYSECKNNIEHARTLASNIGQYRINYSDIPSDFSGKGMLLSLSEKVFRLAPQIKNYGTLLENWERHVRDIENIGNDGSIMKEAGAPITLNSDGTFNFNYDGNQYPLKPGVNYFVYPGTSLPGKGKDINYVYVEEKHRGTLPEGLEGTTIYIPSKITSNTSISLVLPDSGPLIGKENQGNVHSLWRELYYGKVSSNNIIIMPRPGGGASGSFKNEEFQNKTIQLVEGVRKSCGISNPKEINLAVSSASSRGGMELAGRTIKNEDGTVYLIDRQNSVTGKKYFSSVTVIEPTTDENYRNTKKEDLKADVQAALLKGVEVTIYGDDLGPDQIESNNEFYLDGIKGQGYDNNLKFINLTISDHGEAIRTTYEQNTDFRANKLGIYTDGGTI